MNCNHCGAPLVEGAAACDRCGAAVAVNPVEVKAPENVALGFVGALVGAIIGGASIVLLSQLGYVAAISGLLTAFCTLKGYELLGKGLSKKGVVICAILMILTPFAADWLDWGLWLYKDLSAYGASYFECVGLLPTFLADGSIAMGDYLKNLGILYLFVVLGGFGTMKSAFKK